MEEKNFSTTANRKIIEEKNHIILLSCSVLTRVDDIIHNN